MESATPYPEEKNVKAIVRWTSHSGQFARNKTMSAGEYAKKGALQVHTRTNPMSKYRVEMIGNDIEYQSLAFIGAHVNAHTDRQI